MYHHNLIILSSSYHYHHHRLIIILSSSRVSLSCRVGSGSLILMVATHIQPALLLHYSAPPLHCLNITIPVLLHCSKLHNAIPQYCNTNIQSASNYTAPSLPLYHSTIAQYKCPQIYNTFPRYQVSQYPLYHKVLKCAISQICSEQITIYAVLIQLIHVALYFTATDVHTCKVFQRCV